MVDGGLAAVDGAAAVSACVAKQEHADAEERVLGMWKLVEG